MSVTISAWHGEGRQLIILITNAMHCMASESEVDFFLAVTFYIQKILASLVIARITALAPPS